MPIALGIPVMISGGESNCRCSAVAVSGTVLGAATMMYVERATVVEFRNLDGEIVSEMELPDRVAQFCNRFNEEHQHDNVHAVIPDRERSA